MKATTVTFMLVITGPVVAQERLPVIDMHLHALPADANGPPPLALCVPVPAYPTRDTGQAWGDVFIEWQKNPPCSDPVWSPQTDEALKAETIAELERLNVIGVLSGTPERVEEWTKAAPDRFIGGLQFQFDRDDLSPDALRSLYQQGRFAVFAEVTNQYVGIAPDDPRFEPYLAVAEELDIPVGIHIGTGPPGAPYLGFDRYRAALHSPFTLEAALVRHPDLRIYIMHAGWPMLDDLLAVLWAHPQVYVDVGGIVFGLPRAEFYRYLERIVGAGFGKRVMFGSDQMVWPGVIERSIQSIESAPFLSAIQKRDILYNNAARFLRLSEDDIARHHGRQASALVDLDAMSESFRNTTLLIAIREAGFRCDNVVDALRNGESLWTASCGDMLAYTVSIRGGREVMVEPIVRYFDSVF